MDVYGIKNQTGFFGNQPLIFQIVDIGFVLKLGIDGEQTQSPVFLSRWEAVQENTGNAWHGAGQIGAAGDRVRIGPRWSRVVKSNERSRCLATGAQHNDTHWGNDQGLVACRARCWLHANWDHGHVGAERLRGGAISGKQLAHGSIRFMGYAAWKVTRFGTAWCSKPMVPGLCIQEQPVAPSYAGHKPFVFSGKPTSPGKGGNGQIHHS